MRRELLAILVLVVPAWSHAKPPAPGKAKPSASSQATPAAKPKRKSNPADIPSMVNAGSSSEKNVLTVKCDLVPGSSPRRAMCRMIQAIVVGPPDPAQTANAVKLFKELSNKKNKKGLADFMKEACSAGTLARWDNASAPAERDFANKVRAACKTKDSAALVDALVWRTENIDAHTCTLETFAQDPVEFVQKNADTWVTTISGICGATTTITLWRNPGDYLWNYKQVRTFPPNAKEQSELCSGAADYTAEWRWDLVVVREIGCQFLGP